MINLIRVGVSKLAHSSKLLLLASIILYCLQPISLVLSKRVHIIQDLYLNVTNSSIVDWYTRNQTFDCYMGTVYGLFGWSSTNYQQKTYSNLPYHWSLIAEMNLVMVFQWNSQNMKVTLDNKEKFSKEYPTYKWDNSIYYCEYSGAKPPDFYK